MSIEHEARKSVYNEKMEEKQIMEEFAEAGDAIGQATPDAVPEGMLRIDFSFLLKKTGPGTVDAYLDHPMNSKRSKGRGRFLRGCTGIAGDLDLAIIDIALGGFEMVMEKRSGNDTAD